MRAFTFWKVVTVDQQEFLERYRTLRDTLTTDSEPLFTTVPFSAWGRGQ